jgi:hypothetical protein
MNNVRSRPYTVYAHISIAAHELSVLTRAFIEADAGPAAQE